MAQDDAILLRLKRIVRARELQRVQGRQRVYQIDFLIVGKNKKIEIENLGGGTVRETEHRFKFNHAMRTEASRALRCYNFKILKRNLFQPSEVNTTYNDSKP